MFTSRTYSTTNSMVVTQIFPRPPKSELQLEPNLSKTDSECQGRTATFSALFSLSRTPASLASRVRFRHFWTPFERVVILPQHSRCDATGLFPHTLPAKVLRVAQEESRPPERARVCAATNTASYRREPWHWQSSPTRSHARTDTHASAGRACTHEHTPTNTRRSTEHHNMPRTHASVSCHSIHHSSLLKLSIISLIYVISRHILYCKWVLEIT